jgi:hypothetical protein
MIPYTEYQSIPQAVEQPIALKYRGHKLVNGMLTVTFVAPAEVYDIVKFQAVVHRKPDTNQRVDHVADGGEMVAGAA